MRIFICRPDLHQHQYFPRDLVHLLHKYTLGILLIDHLEPSGAWAASTHAPYILFGIELRLIFSTTFWKRVQHCGGAMFYTCLAWVSLDIPGISCSCGNSIPVNSRRTQAYTCTNCGAHFIGS